MQAKKMPKPSRASVTARMRRDTSSEIRACVELQDGQWIEFASKRKPGPLTIRSRLTARKFSKKSDPKHFRGLNWYKSESGSLIVIRGPLPEMRQIDRFGVQTGPPPIAKREGAKRASKYKKHWDTIAAMKPGEWYELPDVLTKQSIAQKIHKRYDNMRGRFSFLRSTNLGKYIVFCKPAPPPENGESK